MNGLKENPTPQTHEIVLTIRFNNGDTFTQPFPIDEADEVQAFVEWLREPGKSKTWTWYDIINSQIRMFNHSHIMAVDIDGYIEPNGRKTRWYERMIDKMRVKLLQK